MDYNDYIDNIDDDHSYDVEDDDEWYDLVVARCHVVVTCYMKYIDKQPYRDSDQTFYKWLMDCWLVMKRNVMKCLEWSRKEINFWKIRPKDILAVRTHESACISGFLHAYVGLILCVHSDFQKVIQGKFFPLMLRFEMNPTSSENRSKPLFHTINSLI